jgi:hypothetical protein
LSERDEKGQAAILSPFSKRFDRRKDFRGRIKTFKENGGKR